MLGTPTRLLTHRLASVSSLRVCSKQGDADGRHAALQEAGCPRDGARHDPFGHGAPGAADFGECVQGGAAGQAAADVVQPPRDARDREAHDAGEVPDQVDELLQQRGRASLSPARAIPCECIDLSHKMLDHLPNIVLYTEIDLRYPCMLQLHGIKHGTCVPKTL